jgi:hypothetical protein
MITVIMLTFVMLTVVLLNVIMLTAIMLNVIILVSISPTFYEQLLRQNPFAKKLQTQIVST